MTAVGLMIGGGIAVVVAFLGALINMGVGVSKDGEGFGGMFIGHLIAMGVMFIGGVTLAGGFIWWLIQTFAG